MMMPGRVEVAIIRLFHQRYDWTTDEAASELGMHFGDVRPVFTYLTQEKRAANGRLVRPALIHKTKFRRNSSARGNGQYVYHWKAKK